MRVVQQGVNQGNRVNQVNRVNQGESEGSEENPRSQRLQVAGLWPELAGGLPHGLLQVAGLLPGTCRPPLVGILAKKNPC